MYGAFRRLRWPIGIRTAVLCGGTTPLPGRREEPERSRVVHFSSSAEDRVQNLHRAGFLGLIKRAAEYCDLQKYGFRSNRTPEPLTISKHPRTKGEQVAVAREVGAAKQGPAVKTDNLPGPATPAPEWDSPLHYRFLSSMQAQYGSWFPADVERVPAEQYRRADYPTISPGFAWPELPDDDPTDDKAAGPPFPAPPRGFFLAAYKRVEFYGLSFSPQCQTPTQNLRKRWDAVKKGRQGLGWWVGSGVLDGERVRVGGWMWEKSAARTFPFRVSNSETLYGPMHFHCVIQVGEKIGQSYAVTE